MPVEKGHARARTIFRRLAVAAGVLLAMALLALLFADPILRTALATAGKAAGYDVAYDRLSAHGGHLTIEHPDVASLGGEPVFSATRIDLTYSLRDALGGPYPYGISALEIDRPKITFIRHKDGSTNISLPSSSSQNQSAAIAIPRIHLIVKDGSLGIVDDSRIFAHSRRLTVEDVQLDADLEGKGRSLLTLGLAILEEGGKYSFLGRGTLDETRGYEMTRIHAKALALAPLLDYVLNTETLHFSNGMLNDIDARVYGLLDRSGVMQRHVSVTGNLDHFQPYLNGIVKPLRDGRGAVRAYDDGVTFPKVDGSIAGVPVRIAGAIYNLTHPVVRLGITGHGDLSRLITLSDAAKKFPLSGPLAFTLLVEGDATSPTTFAVFHSRQLHYARIPLDAPSGEVALHGEDTSILHAGLWYDGMQLETHGQVGLGKHTSVDMLATIAAPAQRVPYAAGLLGRMVVNGSAVVAGVDADLQTTGVVAGRSATQSLKGTFSVDGRGEGTLGPFTLDGPGDRRLFARVALDRPQGGGGAAFVVAHAFHVSTAGRQPVLPGIAFGRVPPVDFMLDADAAGAFAGKKFALGGSAHAYAGRAFGLPIGDITASGRVADGPVVALRARYRGALGPLAAAAGGKIAASGRADMPLFLMANGTSNVLAQIAGARFDRANVAGIPLQALDATVGLRGKTVDVYAARVRLGGNDIVARGSFGNGGTLEVSASGIDLSKLRAAGLNVSSGTLAAFARVSGSTQAPRVDGGIVADDVSVPDARYSGLAVSANTGIAFSGDTLALTDGLVRAGPAVASLDGRVDGLRHDPAAARYTFDAHVRQADIAALARLAKTPLRYPEGSLNADLHVSGSGTQPDVSGTIGIPEGSVNGLAFSNAHVGLAGNPSAMRAYGGQVTFGGSVVGFDAALSSGAQSFALHAPRIELADLDDYFDQGDTLGGAGSVDATVQAGTRLITSGRVRLQHTRFRRFDLGDTRADWSTSGRRVDTVLALGTTAGRVTANGSITLPASSPLRNTFARSYITLDGQAQGVDLATWLPAAGIVAPVSGFVNANASVRGSYPNVALNAHASIENGTVQRMALRTASIDIRAANGRATIANAALAIDNLTASASGSVGLRPTDAVDLHLSAQTQDVGALAKTVTGKTYDVAGKLAVLAAISGTPQNPSLDGTLDADAIRYQRFTLAHGHADALVSRTRATLRAAEFDLANGRLLASGTVPLRVGGAQVISESAPLQANFTADHVDLGQFAALLPKGTDITGLLNGSVAVIGTRAAPGLRGSLALTNASFVGPQLRSKLSNGVAELAFAGRTITLQNAQVAAGGGTITATGRVTVPDLRDPAQSASATFTMTSNNAVIDAPKYIKGRINGTVTLNRAPGAVAQVGGSLAFSSTRVPTTILLPSGGPSPAPSAAALPVAFNLNVEVGDDVRVQGGPVDIGAKGRLHVGGTLASPQLAGRLTATGGTLSFYRTFRLQDPSVVTFEPTDGLIPTVDAVATTSIDNPPTDVTLHVTGLATQLNVALDSDPSYSRAQILGLLLNAQALGAVAGVQTTANGPQQNPFQAAAEGQLGSLLTQNILEPFSSQLGSAVGLNNLAINFSPGSGVDIGAQKKLFRNVSAVFAESFNYPPRESLGLRASPNSATAIQLTFFSQPSSNKFNSFEGAQALQSSDSAVTNGQPANGASGFSLSFQRKFR